MTGQLGGCRPRRDNLPWDTSSFVGRDHQVVEVADLIRTHRLLTLSGTGGVGKTRLALQAARRTLDAFPHGVWYVELAGLRDPRLVLHAVARALTVTERPDQELTESAAAYLAERHVLLVLDNCEHLSTACARLAERILQASGRSHVLTTSRHPLGLPGELVWQVPSLSLPEQSGAGARAASPSEAVQLFTERAQAGVPDFVLTDANAPAVAAICQQLDGIPLALEMAAARLRAFSVQEIADRLDDRLQFLSTGSMAALPRHQTLQATMDWSYDLLDADEQRLLQRLSVFISGCDFEAIEAVCGDGRANTIVLADLLARLVDRSLVQVDHRRAASRYQLLETVRQYAAQRLRAFGEEVAVRGRHRAYFLGLAEQAQPALRGSNQATWLRRLEVDHGNLRAALVHTDASCSNDAWTRLRLATALGWFWRYAGHFSEGRRWLDAALASVPAAGAIDQTRQSLVTMAFINAGLLAFSQGALEAAEGRFETALARASQANDAAGIAWARHGLGRVAHLRGDYERSASLLEASLGDFAEVGDEGGRAYSLLFLAIAAGYRGAFDRAIELYHRTEQIFRELGETWGLAWTLANLAHLDHLRGDDERAERLFRESLPLAHELSAAWCIDACLRGLAMIASASGATVRSVTLFAAAEALHEATGTTMPEPARLVYARRLEAVRDCLDAAVFDQVWSVGTSFTTAEAIDLALAPDRLVDNAEPVKRPPCDSPLSPRELEVAALIGRGLTNRQIADDLIISERTVHAHVGSILRKLDLSSRALVAVWSAERGLTSVTRR
jgi:predicted ATPase/DNA-binding CsgD family transcriptional regulator